jgi:phosphatidylglycerol lysyltransferase
VLRHGWNATAFQILNPGLELWFSRQGDAVAGYARHRRVRVVAGAPVCRPERLGAVADELEADAAGCGERVLFFGAGARLEQAVAARAAHCLVRLGAQPVWDPQQWPRIVRGKASLRAQLYRARNKGVWISEWPAERAQDSAELRRVLHQWLATRGLPPLGFLVTPDLLGQMADRRVFVAERGGEVVAFLVATPVPARAGWLVEQWPRAPAAPNGTTHLLVDAAMTAFAAVGSRYVTLGLAPLCRHGCGPGGPGGPAWLRLALGWLRAHGRRFYNFAGLETFKASLQPLAWEPIFAIAPGPRFGPGLLHAVAGVFGSLSHGSPERLVALAVASAVRQEWRTLRSGPGR